MASEMTVEQQPRAAQVIPDSRGGRMEVASDAIAPGGASYTFDWYLAPHTPAAPLHSHPRQEERFEALAGDFTFTLGKTTHILHRGETLAIPVGALHAVANDTDAEICVRTVFTPALDIHTFFETFFAIERSSQGLRQLARMSVLFREMPEYVRFPAPLSLVVIVLASVTRLLGYRLPAATHA